MRSPNSELKLGQAIALGALHGPAELLPISSSAHTEAVPLLLGWSYAELEPGVRKEFEVALHAGTVLALAAAICADRRGGRSALGGWRLAAVAVASVPPALGGYLLEQQIERRLGTASTLAAALIAGAVVMAAADRFPQERRAQDVAPQDALWLGVAQAVALIPGVSRAGATRSAARMLRFRRPDAAALSQETGVPVLIGATLLKAARLAGRDIEPRTALTFIAAIAASALSTLAAATALRSDQRSQRLWPYAVYRVALAGLLLNCERRRSTARRPARTRV